jgi:hypothetical protein
MKNDIIISDFPFLKYLSTQRKDTTEVVNYGWELNLPSIYFGKPEFIFR